MMKLISFILLLLSMDASAQSRQKGFTIHGELTGLKDGTVLYLEHNNDNGGSDTVARVTATDGKFSFSGFVEHEAEPYFIKIDTSKTKYEREIVGLIAILMENKAVEVKGDISDLSIPAIKVSGSPAHDEFVSYYVISDSMMAISNGLLDRMNTAYGKGDTVSAAYFQRQFDDARTRFNEVATTWIVNHPGSMVTPWLIDQIYRGELEKLKSFYGNLEPRVQNSKTGRDLHSQIIALEKTAEGRVAPNFQFPDQDGKNISLKEVVQKSKLTVLEFWASWCAPCLEEFPKMKEIYSQYHDKGLNILAYSVDDKESDWKKAIAKNNLKWYNIRETSKAFAEKEYGVTGLPQIFLLNEKGEIVSKPVTADELQKKIIELMNQ